MLTKLQQYRLRQSLLGERRYITITLLLLKWFIDRIIEFLRSVTIGPFQFTMLFSMIFWMGMGAYFKRT